MKLRSVISHAALKVAVLAGMMSLAGADAGAVDDPCQLKFKQFASRRFVLDNELTLAEYKAGNAADEAHPSAVFDRTLKEVGAWCQCGHYSAEVVSVTNGGAARMVFALADGAERMEFVFCPGKQVAAVGAEVRAVEQVVPAPPFKCSLTVAGRTVSMLVTKEGRAQYLGAAKIQTAFDWRSASASQRGKFFVDTRQAEVGRATVALSAGYGQADVRFVTTGRRDKRLYFERGRVFFTFSPRGIGALGVASFDPAKFDVRLEGCVLFDAGDGLLRGDGPADLYYDEEAKEWRAWVCNFSTVSAKDGTLSGREKGGINFAWSKTSPLKGLTVMQERSLGMEGMNEDPTCFYDEEARKWRMFLSEFTPQGIRGSLWESEEWNGKFVRVTAPTAEDSTGQCLVALGGRRWALAGSADRACHVYEYPSLKLRGDIDFDLPPWSAECPNGRVWATLAVLPEGYPSRYVFLTMDRVNFPGIPDPNWTYGALHLYYGFSKSLAGVAWGQAPK